MYGVCICDYEAVFREKACGHEAKPFGVVMHMGGCQDYGPFLVPYHNTASISRAPKRGP